MTSTTATSPTPVAVINPTSAAAASKQVGSGLQSLTSNFQTFLSLLTTQLRNQDPLSPVDSNQFTQQLVQMSGVQQQLLTNGLLTSLVGQGQNGLASGASYIGKTVQAQSATATLTGHQANWTYQLASNAASAQLEIDDAAGNAVWSGPAPAMTAGAHSFSWNGRNASGAQLPDGGVYTLKVAAANSANAAVGAQVLVSGAVTGVQLINNAPYLSIGSSIVPLADVVGVESGAS